MGVLVVKMFGQRFTLTNLDNEGMSRLGKIPLFQEAVWQYEIVAMIINGSAIVNIEL